MEDMIVTFPGNKKVRASYRGNIIDSDQRKEHGGDGSAPPPFDLFLASIANCSATYIIYFCQKRDIPLDNIRLIQRMEKNEETKMIEKIRLIVELPEDFPEKYRQPLLKTIDLCTVKKHIVDGPEFELTWDTA
ncbi:MAG: osmotically inducible protein C [Candidatus Latescibacteria bacterium]|nr:osmotically inducible protein C [bacterium]MBD3423804.1 osmotically inducible protein C [Candidatus Latescibacterota bacterium]